MQYGLCGGPDKAALAADAGYVFIEGTVHSFIRTMQDKADFEASLAEVKAAPLPCPVVNCFLPGTMRVTGPDVDPNALKTYVTTTFERCEQAEVDTVVFGSGGARNVPDGFDRATAHRQIIDFCKMLAPIAEKHGVTVVLEPLESAGCNIITSVSEGAKIVRAVDHPAFKLLADTFHMGRDNEPVDAVAANGDILRHIHIATPKNRVAPGAEDYDFAPFFDALKSGGYDGRISFEGKSEDPARDYPRALELMKSLVG